MTFVHYLVATTTGASLLVLSVACLLGLRRARHDHLVLRHLEREFRALRVDVEALLSERLRERHDRGGPRG